MSLAPPVPSLVPPAPAPALGAADDAPRPRSLRPLRIAMVAPPWFELPPRGYGGTEAVVAALVDGLVARGHEVVLIAAGRHRTMATGFHAIYPEAPTELLGTPLPEVVAAAEAARVLAGLEVDLVHDHTLAGPLLARGRPTPTLTTMHGPVDGDYGDYYRRLGDSIGLVAISEAQRRKAPEMHWVGMVHNAIDVASFPFRAEKDDYLLWLGRCSPDKGAHLAIEAARASGRRILLAGKRNEPAEHRYFDEVVRPMLGRDAEFLGEADAEQKRELLAGARALMFPIQWDEPFGMVMAEAMACGTPVVALRRGSVPEVVEQGRSGIIVEQPEELPAAIRAADTLDPVQIRLQAIERFDLPVMAARYEAVYRARLAAVPAPVPARRPARLRPAG